MQSHLNSLDCLHMNNIKSVSAASQCVTYTYPITLQFRLYTRRYTYRIYTCICMPLYMHVCVYIHMYKLQLYYHSKNPLHFMLSSVRSHQYTEKEHKRLCISIKAISVTWEDIHANFCLIHIGYNTRGNVMA